MSNHLAIATVTATLQRLLQAGIQRDLDGARVTTVRPGSAGGLPDMGVNVFLYQVLSNAALQNADTTPFRTKGMALRRQAALDFYYILSFYGNEADLEPQRLLGSVVRTLNDYPSLSSTLIQDTVADSTLGYLADSDLATQPQAVKLMPMDLALEDLSKIWSIFFQTPYALSIAYKASAIIIEGLDSGQRALPISHRYPQVSSPYGAYPVVEQILSTGGRYDPITATSTLRILGQNLKGTPPLVRIGPWSGEPEVVSDRELHLPLRNLGAALHAGVQTLQVVHSTAVSAPRTGHTPPGRTHGLESNGVPFVVRPRVTAVTVAAIAGSGEDPRSGSLAVETDVALGLGQRYLLTLNPWTATTDQTTPQATPQPPPQTYVFEGRRHPQQGQQAEFPILEVPPGEYLVRLQVDGAESLLESDEDANSPTYRWYIAPRVVIP